MDEPLDARLARIAGRQHGVVSVAQLCRLGLSASAVRKRAAVGRLHRIHRGVYAVGRADLDRRGRRMAAVLACSPGAVLSHRTAAVALGLLRSERPAIDLTIPIGSRRGRPGLTVHRSPGLSPENTTTVERIPCTTTARTLLDLAAVVSATELARAIEAAERLRLFDGRQIEALLERAKGHSGASRLRAALVAYSEPQPTREEFERLAFEVLAQTPLGTPLVNALIDTAEERLEVDFSWPERRLVVEADSWEFHKTRAAFERDRRRDQLLVRAGWTPLRITWRQVSRAPHEVIAAIA